MNLIKLESNPEPCYINPAEILYISPRCEGSVRIFFRGGTYLTISGDGVTSTSVYEYLMNNRCEMNIAPSMNVVSS